MIVSRASSKMRYGRHQILYGHGVLGRWIGRMNGWIGGELECQIQYDTV